MFRILTARQLAFDIGLAVGCVLLRATLRPDSAVLWIVVLVMAAALALRRLSPGLALTVAWAGAILQIVALLPPDVSNLAILAVLFTTARYGSRLVSRLGLVSAAAGAVIVTAYLVVGPFVSVGTDNSNGIRLAGAPQLLGAVAIGLVASIGLFGLSWTLGLLAKTWANARESRRQQGLAERTVVVEQERNRIARDMHDVVAHSLAVVIAQADGARYAHDDESKNEALATISSTARDALADVRLLLGQLRHSEEPGPQPVLADLERLFEQLRASGLTVDVEQHGEALALPAGQQLALYRIVQEALTNALRHGAPGQPVTVALDWTADAAHATITSALATSAPAAPASGHGLAGMRERAILAGGTFSATPDGDTFVVTASIPVRAKASA